MPGPASPIPRVPTQTDFFDTWPQGWIGHITRTWIIFFEDLAKGFQALDKVTFGLGIGGAQAVGNDLTTHGMCFTTGSLLGAYGNAKTPPSMTPLYLDILRSTDQGVTFNSVFKTGGVADANKLVIPAANSKRQKQTVFNVPAGKQDYQVNVGDFWRIDLLAGSGADAQNINVVLIWAVPLINQSIADIIQSL